jgi:hypothetical protein
LNDLLETLHAIATMAPPVTAAAVKTAEKAARHIIVAIATINTVSALNVVVVRLGAVLARVLQ